MGELTISLHIADRPYKLVIGQEHEALFRQAAELIEKRMKDYSVSYTYKDKQDLLAMVALEYATNFLQDEVMLSSRGEGQAGRLAEIDHRLTAYLDRES